MTYLASRLFGTPLLIHRPKLDVILSVVGQRIGMADALPMPAMDMAVYQRPPAAAAPGGIAVIPIHGSLVKRSLGMEASSGLTSYGEIAAMLDAALADPHVSGILLDIDSPGGEASGSFELARRVREVAAVKPVWAVANDAAYSAAYAIAASAQRLFVTETGGVGSIGVIALHVDQSVKDAKDGYRFTAITAGAHKNDYSPHEPLSDGAKTELQGEVDRLYANFTEHVAAMRGLDLDAVRGSANGTAASRAPPAAGVAIEVEKRLPMGAVMFCGTMPAIGTMPAPALQGRGLCRAHGAEPSHWPHRPVALDAGALALLMRACGHRLQQPGLEGAHGRGLRPRLQARQPIAAGDDADVERLHHRPAGQLPLEHQRRRQGHSQALQGRFEHAQGGVEDNALGQGTAAAQSRLLEPLRPFIGAVGA